MKNFNYNLLLATTAILSAGLAIGVNALPYIAQAGADINTTIHAEATLITSLTITEAKKLNFGGIINPKNEDVVEVTATGVLGNKTTAQVIKSSTAAGEWAWGESVSTPVNISAGQITISGDYLKGLISDPEDEYGSESYQIQFPEQIVLSSGGVTCGVVNGFVQSMTEGAINYGGVFTLDSAIENNVTSNATMKCAGEGTVTLVYSSVVPNN